jgi:hypothetical protein
VVRRGQVLVSVRTDGTRADRARDILDQFGAVDVEGRTKEWRQRGWSGYDPGAEPLSADELRREREYYGAVSASDPDRNLTPRELAGADPTLRGKTAWPHQAAYPMEETLVETEMDNDSTSTMGDGTMQTRPEDRASLRAESGFDRAKESAVRSARRMASRIYDTGRR